MEMFWPRFLRKLVYAMAIARNSLVRYELVILFLQGTPRLREDLGWRVFWLPRYSLWQVKLIMWMMIMMFIFLNNILFIRQGTENKCTNIQHNHQHQHSTIAPKSPFFNTLSLRQETENKCTNISFVDIPEHEATFADVCFCNTDKWVNWRWWSW